MRNDIYNRRKEPCDPSVSPVLAGFSIEEAAEMRKNIELYMSGTLNDGKSFEMQPLKYGGNESDTKEE